MNKLSAVLLAVFFSVPCLAQRFVKIGVSTNELVTLNPYDLNNVVLVRGYGSTNDSDGALFQFILGDTTPPDGVTVFAPTNNAGRWKMVRTASHQFGNQFQGGGTNQITLSDDLTLSSVTVTSNSFLTNLSVFNSFTNITDNTYISTTNYTLISTNTYLYTTNLQLLTNTYISFGDTNYVVNIFPGGGTNSVATETFVTNTIVSLVVGTNLYFVFEPSQFNVGGSTNVSIIDGVALTNAMVEGMIVNDLLINGDWAIMTNGVNDIQWDRDALVTSYDTGDASYSFDQLTLSNRRPFSIMRQQDFTNLVDKMFDRTQFDLARGWTNDATLVTAFTNWFLTIKDSVRLTNALAYNSFDFVNTVVYMDGNSQLQFLDTATIIDDTGAKVWNFKLAEDSNTVARIKDLNVFAYQRVMEEGANVTQRTNINFSGLGLTVSDDAGNARTKVQVHTNLDLMVGLSSSTNGFIMFDGQTPTATLRQLQAGGGISLANGGGLSANPIISQDANSTIQKVQVDKNSGGVVGTRSQLNFIEGGGITLTITDDAGGDEVDIQIDNTGNLYNFDPTQFSVNSVTNIGITNGAVFTNLVTESELELASSGTTLGGIGISSLGAVYIRRSSATNLVSYALASYDTNALTLGYTDYAAGFGGAIALPTHTRTNGSETIRKDHFLYSRWATNNGTVAINASTGPHFVNRLYAVKKADDSTNTVTINGLDGDFEYPTADPVLTNQFQSLLFAFDNDFGEYRVIASYNPLWEADRSSLTQVTNIVTSVAPTLVIDNTTKRVQTLIVKNGAGTSVDAIGDSPNAVGAVTSVAVTSTAGVMNQYATAASAHDPNGIYGSTYINTAHDPHLTAFVRTTSNADVKYWVGLGRGSQGPFLTNDTPSATVSADYAAFRFSTEAGDSNWMAGTGDGSSDGFDDTGVAPDTANTTKLEIVSSGDGTSFEFKINGTSVATRTALLPSTANLFYFIAGTSSTPAAAAKNIQFSRSVISLDE